MDKRTCSLPECNRPHRARGLCASHYNQEHAPNRHAKKLVTCAWCGTEVLKHSGGGRKYGQVCSDQCRQYLSTPYCILPADHWARWYGKASAWTPPKPKAIPKMQRECEWCGMAYETHQSRSKFCTEQCSGKSSKAEAQGKGARGTRHVHMGSGHALVHGSRQAMRLL
jgi:hypothetical protein